VGHVGWPYPLEKGAPLRDSTKYIGMDVHKDAMAVAVMNSAGKVVRESILETKAATILQFVRGLRGNLLVTWEEGTWAAWLYELLKPYVTQVTVCNPRKNALLKSGNKGDRIDAQKLAELLRHGSPFVGLPWRKGLANAEGAVPQLSDAQQRSDASDESAQGAVP
jgi:Transposase